MIVTHHIFVGHLDSIFFARNILLFSSDLNVCSEEMIGLIGRKKRKVQKKPSLVGKNLMTNFKVSEAPFEMHHCFVLSFFL